MMTKRRGMGKGKGKGYKNMIPNDHPVHVASGRGEKQPQKDIQKFNKLWNRGYDLKLISKKMGIGSGEKQHWVVGK